MLESTYDLPWTYLVCVPWLRYVWMTWFPPAREALKKLQSRVHSQHTRASTYLQPQ
jgi:hypothetical protein